MVLLRAGRRPCSPSIGAHQRSFSSNLKFSLCAQNFRHYVGLFGQDRFTLLEKTPYKPTIYTDSDRGRPINVIHRGCPPEAEVRGSNPLGRTIYMKDLRESAGPFFMAVSKLCPWCVRKNSKANRRAFKPTFALNQAKQCPGHRVEG